MCWVKRDFSVCSSGSRPDGGMAVLSWQRRVGLNAARASTLATVWRLAGVARLGVARLPGRRANVLEQAPVPFGMHPGMQVMGCPGRDLDARSLRGRVQVQQPPWPAGGSWLHQGSGVPSTRCPRRSAASGGLAGVQVFLTARDQAFDGTPVCLWFAGAGDRHRFRRGLRTDGDAGVLFTRVI